MVIFPNCKINIGLRVLGKRADGYHNLETIFLPVPLYDVLEIVPFSKADDHFTQTGISIEGHASTNLCLMALRLMRNRFPDLPPVQIHLHKIIPVGAGLGGGSSDGAFTLLLLNQLFKLELDLETLAGMALQLGSDCPFFIFNQAGIATGRGEEIKPIPINLKGKRLVLINPGIHINTGWAFSQLTSFSSSNLAIQLNQIPITEWKHYVTNDFQVPIANHYPVIQQIIEYCLAEGALFAAMTGTGSTCYALFDEHSSLPLFSPFQDSWIHCMKI